MDRSISPTIELETTKARLTVQESRYENQPIIKSNYVNHRCIAFSVKHLTSLLAEAEQDLAKLTQLNDILKEELRRQERSAAREQHLHNLEYLKNVIFKVGFTEFGSNEDFFFIDLFYRLQFLTINCGDEKSHLVPVLNTILKLSPDETQKLERAARGSLNFNLTFV